jgi:hypothetical protein
VVFEWKEDDCTSEYDKNTEIRYVAAGYEGRGILFENAHKIEVGHHYNGSGDDVFGGAEKWPVISLELSFQEGEEKKAVEFAKKLMLFLEKETLPPPPKRIIKEGIELPNKNN